MVYAACAVCFIRYCPTRGSGLAHGVECPDQLTFAPVILPAPRTNNLQHLQHKRAFGCQRERVRYGGRPEPPHYLVHRLAVTAGHVDTNMLDVVFVRELFNHTGLLFKFQPLHLQRLHRAEFAAPDSRRYNNRQRPAVAVTAAAVSVVANPHRTITHRTCCERFPVIPLVIAIHATAQQGIKVEGGFAVADKLAHVEIAELIRRVHVADFVDTGERPAQVHCILNRHDLPPRTVGAQHSTLQGAVGHINLPALTAWSPGIPPRAVPELKRLVHLR